MVASTTSEGVVGSRSKFTAFSQEESRNARLQNNIQFFIDKITLCKVTTRFVPFSLPQLHPYKIIGRARSLVLSVHTIGEQSIALSFGEGWGEVKKKPPRCKPKGSTKNKALY